MRAVQRLPVYQAQPDDQAALKFLGSNEAEVKADQESDTIQVVATDFERETMVGTPSILADENMMYMGVLLKPIAQCNNALPNSINMAST